MRNKLFQIDITPGLRLALALVLLLIGFQRGVATLDAQSLWLDEGWTAYAVRNPAPATFEPPRGIRAQLRETVNAARADFSATLNRVRGDVHPPLYFLALDAWTWLAGDSEFALRYPSLLAGLLAVALMVALGRRLGGDGVGLGAGLLLISGPLWIYYAQEARMYTLLMAFGVGATLAYARLFAHPTPGRGLLYALMLALGVYTHYAALFVGVAHGLHALLTGPRRLLPWLMGAVGGALLFAPWMPFAWAQVAANPSGSLAVPVPTDAAALSGLWLLLTAGWGWAYAALLALGVWAMRERPRAWGLAAVWLVVTPAALLTINALVAPAYQVRYALAALPAFALMTAFAVRRAPLLVAAPVLITLAAVQTGAAADFFPPKPSYRCVAAAVAEVRDPLAPIITDIAPRDPVRYYAERTPLTAGPALDLSWRDHTPGEVRSLTAGLSDADSVWLVMPVNVAKTWVTAAALAEQGRFVGYRDAVLNMVFYRFDRPSVESRLELPLDYHFGDGESPAATHSGPVAAPMSASAGDDVCLPAGALAFSEDDLTVGLTLVRGYNVPVAQADLSPDDAPCLTVPDGTPPGDYALYLSLHRGGAPLPVMQGPVNWGTWLVAYTLAITP